VIGRSAAAAAGATVAFFVLSHGANVLFTPTLPPVPAPGAAGLAIMALAVASFAAVAVLQVLAPLYAATPGWRAARVHVANGLYVNAAFNRLVGALRAPTATPS
jgi:NAD(P)H-quinone oxidoreductase subunit 5